MRAVLLALCLAAPAAAQVPAMHPGPVFPDVAPIATIESDMPLPAEAVFKVTYDVTAQATPGSVNRAFETAPRFINGHVEAGVPAKNINIAYVVHGKAIIDLLKPAAYAARTDGKANATAALVEKLLAHQVNFYICGQSAVAQGIAKSELLPGVKMAISASSAHAMLGMQGYTLIPF
jgi:intracellular sulfur oxidation DsrE/DsrF family protein